MKSEEIKRQIKTKKARLELYYKREAEMLDGGVQSYGLGSRNATRYNTDLATVRAAIEKLEKEIGELEGQLTGRKPRRTVGIIPRDF